MSAWSLAAWIVKQLQKNFDFTSQINSYVTGLNTLNQRVNNLNNTVLEKNELIETLGDSITIIEETISNMDGTIVDQKNNANKPSSYENELFSKGTIWLVLKNLED